MIFRLSYRLAANPLSWLSRSQSVVMPLRAKILSPPVQTAQMSTAPKLNPGEEPGDEPDDVLFNSLYGVRTIELNRPKKLNSLNGSMARKIIPRLKQWEKSELASVIVMAGVGEKAFCAGGDVAALALYNQEGPVGQARSTAYFGLEYQLDHLIATYPKPYVAYMDGITMGGGAGLSVHAPIRIATERTVYAMPETFIGFFPDVGGSFFLSRLDGEVGTYLALTGSTLRGVNAFYAGIASHYIDSSNLGALTARLGELVFKDYAPLDERLSIVDTTVDEFSTGLPPEEPMLLVGELRKAIDRCFHHNTVETIIKALEQERTNEQMRTWAEDTIRALSQRSPTSLKVALRAVRLGQKWKIADTFQSEHHMAARFMEHPDFVSGVSAKLIKRSKDVPNWEPSRLEDVSTEDVDTFFNAEGTKKLQLLSSENYADYPYKELALPRERDIKEVIQRDNVTPEQAMGYFLGTREKLGVREKVTEVLRRKCSLDEKGRLMWRSEIWEESSMR